MAKVYELVNFTISKKAVKIKPNLLISKPIMTPEEFINCKLTKLVELTGISKSKWSQYFNNHSFISESTLIKVAPKLSMQPHEVLYAIEIRRKATLAKKLTKVS